MLKDKMKTYNFWISLVSAIVLIVRIIAEKYNFFIDTSLIMDLTTGLCSIFVILGILSVPKTKSENNLTDTKNNSILNKILSIIENPTASDSEANQTKNQNSINQNEALNSKGEGVDNANFLQPATQVSTQPLTQPVEVKAHATEILSLTQTQPIVNDEMKNPKIENTFIEEVQTTKEETKGDFIFTQHLTNNSQNETTGLQVSQQPINEISPTALTQTQPVSPVEIQAPAILASTSQVSGEVLLSQSATPPAEQTTSINVTTVQPAVPTQPLTTEVVNNQPNLVIPVSPVEVQTSQVQPATITSTSQVSEEVLLSQSTTPPAEQMTSTNAISVQPAVPTQPLTTEVVNNQPNLVIPVSPVEIQAPAILASTSQVSGEVLLSQSATPPAEQIASINVISAQPATLAQSASTQPLTTEVVNNQTQPVSPVKIQAFADTNLNNCSL